MDTKKVVAVGATIILSSGVFYYVFSSWRRKKPKTRSQKLIEAFRDNQDIRKIDGVEIEAKSSIVTSTDACSKPVKPTIQVKDEKSDFASIEKESSNIIPETVAVKISDENCETGVRSSNISSASTSETDNSYRSSSGLQSANNHDSNLAAANGHILTEPPSSITQKVIDNEITGNIPSSHDIIKNTAAAAVNFEKKQKSEDSNREYFEQCFNIPTRAVGKIIGREGTTIKSIQRVSGASLKFASNTRDKSRPFQKLFVRGKLKQITDAVFQLVRTLPSDTQCYDLIDWTPEKALTGKLRSVDLSENMVFIGRVTHVDSPQAIWVQVCRGHDNIDYHQMLSNLTDNMTETLSRKKYDIKECLMSPQDIGVGVSCTVMSDRRCWRGTIIKPGTPYNNVHLVRLVDFGTCDTFTEIYKLSSYYLTMPMLAVQCSLAHVSLLEEDKVWPPGASSYLEEKLRNGFVKAKILNTSQNVHSIEMYYKDADNESLYINRELVLEGYAEWTETVRSES